MGADGDLLLQVCTRVLNDNLVGDFAPASAPDSPAQISFAASLPDLPRFLPVSISAHARSRGRQDVIVPPVRVPGEDAGQLEHGAAPVGPQGGDHRVSENSAEVTPLIAGTLRPRPDRLDDRQP